MLRVVVIAVGLLMASAGLASAPPSPKGGRKPSPSEAPAAEAAPAAETPAAPAAPAESAPPTPAPAAPAPAAHAKRTAKPSKS